MDFSGRGTNLFSKVMSTLMAPFMKGMMLKCINQDLADLKSSIENGRKAHAKAQPA